MVIAARQRVDDHPGARPRRSGRSGGWTVAGSATVALGVALAFLVVQDGSPLWQTIRLLLTAGLTLAALAGQRRLGTIGRGLLTFLSGLVGTAVGVGIGVPHVAKAGLTPTTAAGLLSLASGLVLLVAGGASLVRSARPWPRLLLVPALLAAVFVAVWTLGQGVAATNVAPTALGVATPADRGLSYEDAELVTSDGVTLRGWYVPSTNGAAVALLHGAGSTRSNVLDHTAVLAAHGYGVLAFDARGHGESGGRAMDFGWYGDEDVTAAVSFLAAQPEVSGDRIAAVGMSMGGEEAIGAAAADDRIAAVVAEGATHRVAADLDWLSDEFGPTGWLRERLDWLTYATTDVLTAADQPIALRDAVAAAAPRPVLLIAAGGVPDEGSAGRYIQTGSPETVELWVVPGAGHTDGLDTAPAEWEQRVTSFLDEAIGAGRAP